MSVRRISEVVAMASSSDSQGVVVLVDTYAQHSEVPIDLRRAFHVVSGTSHGPRRIFRGTRGHPRPGPTRGTRDSRAPTLGLAQVRHPAHATHRPIARWRLGFPLSGRNG